MWYFFTAAFFYGLEMNMDKMIKKEVISFMWMSAVFFSTIPLFFETYLIMLGITIVLILIQTLSHKSLYKIQKIVFFMPTIFLVLSVLFSKNIIMWETLEPPQVIKSNNFNWIGFLFITIIILLLVTIFLKKEFYKVSERYFCFNSDPLSNTLATINFLKEEGKLEDYNAEKLKNIFCRDVEHISNLFSYTKNQDIILKLFIFSFIATFISGSAVGIFKKGLEIYTVLNIISFETFVNVFLQMIPMLIVALFISPLVNKEKAFEKRWSYLFETTNNMIIYKPNALCFFSDDLIKNRS